MFANRFVYSIIWLHDIQEAPLLAELPRIQLDRQLSALFLDFFEGSCYDTSRPKIKTFFTGFLKIVIFKWKNEKQNCFTAVENRGFSKRSVMKMLDFPQKTAEL